MAEVGKPGTNWKAVTPENRKKVSGLVRFYMKKPHPFTACVRDNTKRFGPERAKRVCAVVKDLGHGGTGWRKGGKAREDEVVVRLLRELREASELVGGVESVFGPGAAERLAEGEHTGEGWEVVLEKLLVEALALLEGWETLLSGGVRVPGLR